MNRKILGEREGFAQRLIVMPGSHYGFVFINIEENVSDPALRQGVVSLRRVSERA
jgi:hypothetical protein